MLSSVVPSKPMTGTKIAAARRTRRSKSNRWYRGNHVAFDQVNRAALAVLPALLARWLPGGRTEGAEYVALNPRRSDRRLGSFKVNLNSGYWADFACDDVAGGDPISLCAYLSGLRQIDAAKRLAAMLGIGACHGE
jgi:hypothetical protein